MRRRAGARPGVVIAGAILTLAVVAVIGLRMLSPAPDTAVRDRVLPPLALPAGAPLRIVAMGTSLTAHYGWPDQLGAALTACMGRPVEVGVMARGGVGAQWGLDHVAMVAAMAPDIVLAEFAINDADLRLMTRLSTSAATHRRLVTDLRAALPGVPVVLMTMSPARGLRALLRPNLAAHYANYRVLADELDTGLVDLYPRWLARPDPAAGMGDGVHPLRPVAAGMILPVLTPYLATLAGGAGGACGAPP